MIYFDHNATTPIIPEVQTVVIEAMDRFWGNPSSAHSIGKDAVKALEDARDRLSQLLDVSPSELFFTSGGTEADNMAILGTLSHVSHPHLIISAIEHPAVKKAADILKAHKGSCTHIPVDEHGILQLSKLDESYSDDTKMISVMYANNELGTIQPIKEIGQWAEKKNILLHSDAIQAFGKIPLHISKENISLLSISSHKIYGPKGCGALFVKKHTPIYPRTFGGSQEGGLRTGTQNIPAILGFAKAAEIAYEQREQEEKKLTNLTELLFETVSHSIKNVLRNGDPIQRLPGTLNLSFPGTISSMVVEALNNEHICVSGGAACSSHSVEPSHVLSAIGRRRVEAIASVRFSLGRYNTEQEVKQAAETLTKIVKNLRKQNS